jgi:PIN domain nuclease of toxin-antitoxin system
VQAKLQSKENKKPLQTSRVLVFEMQQKQKPKRITTNLKDTNFLQQRRKIRANFKNITNLNVAKLTQTQKKKNKTLQIRFKNI